MFGLFVLLYIIICFALLLDLYRGIILFIWSLIFIIFDGVITLPVSKPRFCALLIDILTSSTITIQI